MLRSAARRRARLRRFAREHALRYVAEPTPRRRAADIFGYGRDRTHLDWLGVPGTTGFEVGGYRCVVESGFDGVETHRWTYGVFTLRRCYPRTTVRPPRYPIHPPRRLRHATPLTPPHAPRYRLLSARPDEPHLRALLCPELFSALASLSRRAALEVVDRELFVSVPRPLDLTSPRLWRSLHRLRDVLAPHLIPPPRVTEPPRGLAPEDHA
ncbi:hypothetical protein RM844_08635 [Streptomyces sp. DSM 44915]|uniref:Uncharacterized protein n=1 Tax=Streptomyces chisholmiae TaxID=3075540 RepID=A0ABU2JN00_9ACTN|nr:hypothetical protein [Streptomyces sp. DSM 44915]MDT0266360.1 hypothetical protein [Streptomyces sp. DSM 44915]